MKFTISRVVCSCGSELEWEPMQWEPGEWIFALCKKCGTDRAFALEQKWEKDKVVLMGDILNHLLGKIGEVQQALRMDRQRGRSGG